MASAGSQGLDPKLHAVGCECRDKPWEPWLCGCVAGRPAERQRPRGWRRMNAAERVGMVLGFLTAVILVGGLTAVAAVVWWVAAFLWRAVT